MGNERDERPPERFGDYPDGAYWPARSSGGQTPQPRERRPYMPVSSDDSELVRQN